MALSLLILVLHLSTCLVTHSFRINRRDWQHLHPSLVPAKQGSNATLRDFDNSEPDITDDIGDIFNNSEPDFIDDIGGIADCPNTQPTKYYKLPDKSKMVSHARRRRLGLPNGYTGRGSKMTLCDLYEMQKYCAKAINSYRAGKPFSDGRKRNHGRLTPVKVAPRLVSKCANEKALSDLKYSNEGAGCGHHSFGSKCGLQRGSGSENSCCTRRCDSLSSCKTTLDGCLKQMWDEGKIVLDTGSTDWTVETGHYWNMLAKSEYVACGFGFDAEGRMLAVQNFFN